MRREEDVMYGDSAVNIVKCANAFQSLVFSSVKGVKNLVQMYYSRISKIETH